MGSTRRSGILLRGMTWGVCMMNDPGLRTVVGIDMPMSDSDGVEGLRIVGAFGTLQFTCKSGTLRSWPVVGFEAIRIYYLLDENAMHIIRILHGKRDLKNILERERTV